MVPINILKIEDLALCDSIETVKSEVLGISWFRLIFSRVRTSKSELTMLRVNP